MLLPIVLATCIAASAFALEAPAVPPGHPAMPAAAPAAVPPAPAAAPSAAPAPLAGKVLQTMNAGGYSYIYIEQADGTKINSSYTAKYDGNDHPVTGAPWDTISIKQLDSRTFTTVMKATGGKYKSTGRTVISKDGKTMTTTSEGINAEGKPFKYIMVWEKQAGDQSGIDASISTHSTPSTPTKPKPDKE